MNSNPDHAHGCRILSAGPGPFVTLRRYEHLGRQIVWRARQHRKGLERAARALETAAVPFWQTRIYNWHIGLFFAVGASLFMLGSMLTFVPGDVVALPGWLINGVFFLGSIPFTIAGYLQHFQAANAGEFSVDPAAATAPRTIRLIGWRPLNEGWLSTFTQFVGTVAFNFNTFDALVAPSGWFVQDLVIWLPGLVGSILFLVSGYLAFIESCHWYWCWRPKDLDWWIVFINLLGCVFFTTAGILAYVPQGPEPSWIVPAANAHLWLGALGFLIGAALLMRESASAE
jgi:hypothetical protein